MTVISTSLEDESKTPMQKFYAGQSVLITGGTGFLGKALIEKLLRSCPDLSSIYLIIRPKKGQDAYHRLDSLFDDPLFEPLKKEMPKFRHKVNAIAGDCSLPGLGISKDDKALLLRNVSIVFNVAATVRFDEKIKQAVAINVSGTKETMDLCRSIHNLKSVIHVSTAYSNCIRSDVDEKFYDPPLTGDNIMKLVQSLDDKKLDAITHTLLGDFPNTYSYTKCIAEQVIQQYGKDLPTGIFRPAIVISTYKEPIVGWVDNVFGPTGALVGGGAGLIRTLNIDLSCSAELIPVDFTVNALIASAWDVANNKNEDADPPIYNYVSTWNKAVTWGDYINMAIKYGKQVPSVRSIWCYSLTATKTLYMYYILMFFLHIIPAFLIDVGLFISGRETKMLKMYKKIHKFAIFTTYFCTKKWDFGIKNTSALWDKLSVKDQEIFYFSMKDFDWDDFMQKYISGIRLYIFKDDPETVPKARKRMARFELAHQILKYAFVGLSLWILYTLFSFTWSLGTRIGASSVSESILIR